MESAKWEKLKAEGWAWVENRAESPLGGDGLGPNGMDSGYARIQELREKHGGGNVQTGNAAKNVEGGPHPIGIPGQYGIYVRQES